MSTTTSTTASRPLPPTPAPVPSGSSTYEVSCMGNGGAIAAAFLMIASSLVEFMKSYLELTVKQMKAQAESIVNSYNNRTNAARADRNELFCQGTSNMIGGVVAGAGLAATAYKMSDLNDQLNTHTMEHDRLEAMRNDLAAAAPNGAVLQRGVAPGGVAPVPGHIATRAQRLLAGNFADDPAIGDAAANDQLNRHALSQINTNANDRQQVLQNLNTEIHNSTLQRNTVQSQIDTQTRNITLAKELASGVAGGIATSAQASYKYTSGMSNAESMMADALARMQEQTVSLGTGQINTINQAKTAAVDSLRQTLSK